MQKILIACGLLGASIVLRAQQAAPAPAGKPIVPVAASTLAENPAVYYGETVSVTGAVEQQLAKLAFSVDQDSKQSAADILILTRTLTEAVGPNSYVVVIGEVVRFEPDEIASKAKEYLQDLPPALVEKYRGKPVILATSVINTAGTDLAKRPPPPLTPAEEAFDKVMKSIGAANRAMRTALEGSDAKAAQDNAAQLQQGLKQSAEFWKSRRVPEAIGWSQDGQKLAESIARAAAAVRWEDVKASMTTLGQVCQTCHTAHRERLDDGTFRIKPL
jgi:hypothetical protein